VLSEEQAGFRPGRSTVDHILSISEVLRARRGRKKQTFCAFLDITKAYDMMNRDGLWKRLIDVGIRGKMWRVLKNLYDIVQSSVLVGKHRTCWFSVEAGVRQGCILSPILFAIFIDGLARMVNQVNVRSVLSGTKFNIALFADDIALLAESEEELQKLLNAVWDYSESWRFRWNFSKSKVMHFGTRRCKSPVHLVLGFHKLDLVNSFKYLGIDLQRNLSWAGTKRRFVMKAKTRIPMVTKAMVEGLSIKAGIKLWETMIRPTVEYAAEILAGENWPQAEQIQYMVGRILLNLQRGTAREVVRGELGWCSLKARREIKLLKLWGRILKMDDARLVKSIYRSCKDQTVSQKGSFCHTVYRSLVSLNLGHIWLSEQIGDFKKWVTSVSASVKERERDLWLLSLQQKSKLRLYRCLKTELRVEEYLSWSVTVEQRSLYARLRSGTHQLKIETGRWYQQPEAERICYVCLTGKVENEGHFMLDCYRYNRLRDKLFASIKLQTGHDLKAFLDDREYMIDVLLGHGLASQVSRRSIGEAVCKFIADAMRVRKRVMKLVEAAK
jgi:hypothetical protein